MLLLLSLIVLVSFVVEALACVLVNNPVNALKALPANELDNNPIKPVFLVSVPVVVILVAEAVAPLPAIVGSSK